MKTTGENIGEHWIPAEKELRQPPANGKKKNQEAVRPSRGRAAPESVADAIMVIDEQSTILSVNHAGQKFFGYDRQELLGRRFTVIMPERLREPHHARIEHWVSTADKCTVDAGFEWIALAKDGREIPLKISFGHWSRDGRHFFIGFIRDLSERQPRVL